jgi:tetratricopeptide (TPR) repeat protein
MNVAIREPAVEGAATVDEKNPWLGLASFTEETRQYFFGRDEEVAELARRVQRKLLTVLFGQSGLGKTSILRAGLVPRLRSQGYCPVYVRIDYGKGSPEPAEQIKQAIRLNARRSGEWTQAGVAVEGESLWEFLHHRDDVLRDESGRTLIPLLIFDQFEEIFTLAQSDDFGRARAARFIAELADLVENRPPKEFETRLEEDESAAERFDFARSDYRVLIALREDYLAPLEGLKQAIPSISQNRLRLAPMTGTQALAAVLEPGKGLVTQEVAEAIVRFVAGGAELANAVVEPSLLSLICRELNDARIAQGRKEISLDLLAGSHATILTNFYERALADQPAAVRRIVEDELLTESGFRENVAEESLVKRFAEAGAAPNTLAVLVNRRLLRIEERLDIRRVELTHDVLCGVVRASRDRRQEREAREATERLLAEQKESEAAAHRAAVRARQIAAGCTVLAAVALVAAVFAYFSGQRARRAEHEAQQTRALAEEARAQAEHLLGYLSDDFGRELESFGRLEVLAEFSQRQIDYFHGLPPALRGTETIRNGALALIHHSRALRTLGQLDVAGDNADEAVKLLSGLRASGDRSEATTIALALAYGAQGRVLESRSDPADLPTSQRAVALLQPLLTGPAASVAAKRAYVEIATRLGFQQDVLDHPQEVIRTEREVMQMATDLGARDLRDLDMGAYYAEAGGWMATSLEQLGRYEEARRSSEECLTVADQVLERRPGYRLALHASQILTGVLTSVARDQLDPAAALRPALRQEQVSLTLLKLDPNNVTSLNNMAVAEGQVQGALWSAGRLHDSAPYNLKQFDYARGASAGGASFVVNATGTMAAVAYFQAALGDATGSSTAVGAASTLVAKLRQSAPPGSTAVVIADGWRKVAEAYTEFARDDLAATRRIVTEVVSGLEPLAPHGELQFNKNIQLYFAQELGGRAAYLAGDLAAAERFEAKAVEARKAAGAEAVDDRRFLSQAVTWLALAQVRQDHTAEAAETIAPTVKFQRELAARNRGDRWQPQELAAALYVQALTDPGRRAALLREAAGLIEGLAPEVGATHEVRQWRARILQAQQTAGTAGGG